jgi:formiminotetrahydrofolate cyclodeaminase
MPYIHESLKRFVDDLSSRTPTPGGGSASALGGALGLGLASMAALYTTQNEKFKSVEAQAKALDDALGALRSKLLATVEADIAAYGAYAEARKLPKNTPEEKSVRSARIATANEEATRIPEQLLCDAREGLARVEELSAIVNPSLAGDVAAAAYFLEACARGAGIQVISNCAADDKEGVNAPRRQRAEAKIAECQAARERVDAAVRKLLK